MPAIVPAKLEQMRQAADRKQAIWDAVGDAINRIKVFNNQILIGTYIAPEKVGNIIVSQGAGREDLYMGCMGLVLQKGPTAFMGDDRHDWLGQNVEVGDWVIFKFSSAWEIHLNGASVRFVDDIDIRAVVDDPALVTSRPIKALGG